MPVGKLLELSEPWFPHLLNDKEQKCAQPCLVRCICIRIHEHFLEPTQTLTEAEFEPRSSAHFASPKGLQGTLNFTILKRRACFLQSQQN